MQKTPRKDVPVAAAAVVLLARSRWVSIAIMVTLIVSIALTVSARAATAVTIVELERFAALTAFDVAIAWAVAKALNREASRDAWLIRFPSEPAPRLVPAAA